MKLREARLALGLTQAELARRMGIDPSVVCHVEAGRVKPYPRFRRISAALLGIPETQLFDGQTET